MASLEKQTPEMRRMKQNAYDFVIVLLDTVARYGSLGHVDLDEKLIHNFRSKVDNDSVLHIRPAV